MHWCWRCSGCFVGYHPGDEEGMRKNILWLEITYTDFLLKAMHMAKEKKLVILENKGI